VGGQKPGFCDRLRYGAKIWEKTRFLKIVGGLPETGFLRDTSLQAKIWEKTRFLKIVDGLPETGFLRQTSLRCEDLGKNPVSKDCGWVARNRVFATDFVTVRRFGKKPGF
jgi:hypothetical protein